MSPVITPRRTDRAALGALRHRDDLDRICGGDRDTEANVLAETLAAVAEGQATQPAGVTGRLLEQLAPALAPEVLDAAIARLRSTGHVAHIGLGLRLTAAGATACLLTDTTPTATAKEHATMRRLDTNRRPDVRTITHRDAERIAAQLGVLADHSPELAAEVRGTFRSMWPTLDRAITEGTVAVDATTAARLACLSDGITGRLDDLRVRA